MARRLAQTLEDDEDLYAAWARAHKGDTVEGIVEAVRSYEALRANPNLKVDVITSRQLRLDPPANPASVSETAYNLYDAATSSPEEGFIRIPVIPEGAHPGKGPEPEGDVLDILSLDPSRVPPEEQLVNPFAYRLSQAGARRVSDLFNAGDFAIITRDNKPLARDEIYAVKHGDRVLLSRVILKGDSLLLLSSHGPTDIEVVRLPGPHALKSVIVGRVAIAIRPWHFALFSPSAAQTKKGPD